MDTTLFWRVVRIVLLLFFLGLGCATLLFGIKSFNNYVLNNKGYIYKVYSDNIEFKNVCIKFKNEKDYEDFTGYYTGYFYEKTCETCK
jgi:hypothetical protein